MEELDEGEEGSSAQHFVALVLCVAPLLYLSVNFLNAWLHPLAPRSLPWVKDAVILIWLEFVLAHAGIFATNFLGVGLHRRTLPGMLLFVLFYGMFIVAFSLVFQRPIMVLVLAVLFFGRLYSVVYARHASQPMLVARSFYTFGVYMACLFFCTVFYHGWDNQTARAVAKLIGERRLNPFYGQAALGCVLYYLAIAALELKLFFAPPRKLLAKIDAAITDA